MLLCLSILTTNKAAY